AAPRAGRVGRRLVRDDARRGRGLQEHAGGVRPGALQVRQEMTEAVPVVGRGFCFEDLKQGFRFRTHRRTLAESDLTAFVNLVWMTEELFTVEDDSSRAIKGRAVPGALVYAFAEGLLLPTMQDTGLAFLNATLDVKAPTRVGDTIHVE